MIGRIALLLAAGAAVQGNAALDSPAPPVPLLFDCRDHQLSVQLLGLSDGRLLLAIDEANREAAASNVQSSWKEIRQGHVIGQGGGHQRHIRLFDGVRHVILLEGEDGSLADRPGRTYAAAISVAPSIVGQESYTECPASEMNANLVANVLQWAESVGATPPRMEDEDGPFDAWF